MNISSATDSPLKSLALQRTNLTGKVTVSPETEKNNNAGADKVTLSSVAKEAPVSNVKTGIEQYALPAWLTDFTPPFYILSDNGGRMEEGRKFVAMSEKLGADGEISQKDQRAIQHYMDTMMPATNQRRHMESHFLQNQDLYNEYGSIKNRYIQASMAEQGITSQQDWFENASNKELDNQMLRLSIREKMLNDPRALELMSLLGVKKPTV